MLPSEIGPFYCLHPAQRGSVVLGLIDLLGRAHLAIFVRVHDVVEADGSITQQPVDDPDDWAEELPGWEWSDGPQATVQLEGYPGDYVLGIGPQTR